MPIQSIIYSEPIKYNIIIIVVSSHDLKDKYIKTYSSWIKSFITVDVVSRVIKIISGSFINKRYRILIKQHTTKNPNR